MKLEHIAKSIAFGLMQGGEIHDALYGDRVVATTGEITKALNKAIAPSSMRWSGTIGDSPLKVNDGERWGVWDRHWTHNPFAAAWMEAPVLSGLGKLAHALGPCRPPGDALFDAVTWFDTEAARDAACDEIVRANLEDEDGDDDQDSQLEELEREQRAHKDFLDSNCIAWSAFVDYLGPADGTGCTRTANEQDHEIAAWDLFDEAWSLGWRGVL